MDENKKNIIEEAIEKAGGFNAFVDEMIMVLSQSIALNKITLDFLKKIDPAHLGNTVLFGEYQGVLMSSGMVNVSIDNFLKKFNIEA